MSAVVKCKAVLSKSIDGRSADRLFVAVPPDYRPRILPCRPKGTLQREQRPEWEYEERPSGKLRVSPSLLATDTGFHTGNPWDCDYEVCPHDASQFDVFYAINPEISK